MAQSKKTSRKKKAPPPEPTISPTELLSPIQDTALIVSASGPQIRPWPRFWARLIDMLFAGFLLGVVDGLPDAVGGVFSGLEGYNRPVLMSVVFISWWAPLEALLLSTWGFTPGKWLLRVHVTDESGRRLGFLKAFLRSVVVWGVGCGFGVRLLLLITLVIQHTTLVKRGKTTYDLDQRVSVHHQIIGRTRLIIAGGILVANTAVLIVEKLGNEAMPPA